MAVADEAWHLNVLDVPALAARGLTGRGVTIGVVDTGVVAAHPDLAGARVRTLDVRGTAFDGVDLNGHGTAMIGLLAGRATGVAPDASIVSVKALVAGAAADLDALVTGIEIALDQGIDVLSLSVGSPDVDTALSQIIQRAVSRGVLVVAAGDDANGTTPLYPAALTPVVSVTASNREGACLFELLPAWLDVAAPGVVLPTLALVGETTVTGTSPATAACAGVCALLLGIAPQARRRALARHMLGILASTGISPTGATGPNTPKLLAPSAAAAAVDAWLVQPPPPEAP